MIPTGLQTAVEDFTLHPCVLVASDFDGVLAPLVLDPAASRAQPGTLETLRELAGLPGVTAAIASGRDLATLQRLTGWVPGEDLVLIGSHGAESTLPPDAGITPSALLDESETETLVEAEDALADIVQRVPDARIEHKPAGVVLHTRGLSQSDADEATASAMRIPGAVAGVHAMRGKSVVELSVLDVSKGAALRALAARVGSEATAYLGDDVTDETAFTVLPSEEGNLTVKVGEGATAAAFRVPGYTDVPDILAALLATRKSR